MKKVYLVLAWLDKHDNHPFPVCVCLEREKAVAKLKELGFTNPEAIDASIREMDLIE